MLAYSTAFLGPVSVEKLSGGGKTLILINNDPDHAFNASACGDSCAKGFLEIGIRKDVFIRLGYFMDFGTARSKDANILIIIDK